VSVAASPILFKLKRVSDILLATYVVIFSSARKCVATLI